MSGVPAPGQVSLHLDCYTLLHLCPGMYLPTATGSLNSVDTVLTVSLLKYHYTHKTVICKKKKKKKKKAAEADIKTVMPSVITKTPSCYCGPPQWLMIYICASYTAHIIYCTTTKQTCHWSIHLPSPVLQPPCQCCCHLLWEAISLWQRSSWAQR